MKKTVLMALVCAFVSVPAAAADDWKDTCSRVSELAKTLMTGRQSGVAMSDAMKAAGGNKLFEGMVISAYEKPRYSTAPVQQRTIEEFRDETYVLCAKEMRK